MRPLIPPAEACACAACVGACERSPGWFAPDEARRALDAGKADRMMVVEFFGAEILSPSADDKAHHVFRPNRPAGRCTFLTALGACEIHHFFKPAECVRSMPHDPRWRQDGAIFRLELAGLWRLPASREIVARWRRERGAGDEWKPTDPYVSEDE